jgi:hypothetical protein
LHSVAGVRRMASGERRADLSVLAPPMEAGEALSSWLVRVAQAHLLTVVELEREIGGSISGLDRGNAKFLHRVAAMTRVDLSALRVIPVADLVAHPMRSGPRPPDCWAVCVPCLQQDRVEGRVPHIRRGWTHPLACFCPVHGAALLPHGASPIKIADNVTLHGDVVDPVEPRDPMLEVADFDQMPTVRRVWRVLASDSGERRLEHRLRLRWAVRDVVDALAANRREPRGGSIASLFEGPLFDRKSLPGSNQLLLDWWGDVDAATRLLYARLALLILAEPPDPADDAKTPLGPSWLLTRYRHSKIIGWQSVFAHAMRDPLFLVTTELPRTMILELGERSRAWPTDLRRRWTYAAAVGAVGGFVY